MATIKKLYFASGVDVDAATDLTVSPESVKTVTSADYTVLDGDGYTTIIVTTGASDRTITLPTLADNQGRVLRFKKLDSGTGKVIVDGEASETIDGSTTNNLLFINDVLIIQATTTEWEVISKGTAQHTNWAVNSGFTPNGFGTLANKSIWWRRVGDTLEVRGEFKAGTLAASTASISLPSGFVIDTAKLTSQTNRQTVGFLFRLLSGTTAVGADSNYTSVFYDGSTTDRVFLSTTSSTFAFDKVNASAIYGNNEVFSFQFSVPISGWG